LLVIASLLLSFFFQVAVAIHLDNIEAAIETYDLLSERWFTHASPTLYNAGTPRPQMSSW